jgi:hypothetical protein
LPENIKNTSLQTSSKNNHNTTTMAENDNNSNNNNNNDNKERHRGFLEGVLHRVTTPIRVIREIQNLEEHLGLERTTLFQDYDSDNDNNTTLPERTLTPNIPTTPNDNNTTLPEGTTIPNIPTTPLTAATAAMPTTSYSFGDFNLGFDDDTPTQNTDFTVGVVISKAMSGNSLRVSARTNIPSTSYLKQA